MEAAEAGEEAGETEDQEGDSRVVEDATRLAGEFNAVVFKGDEGEAAWEDTQG